MTSNRSSNCLQDHGLVPTRRRRGRRRFGGGRRGPGSGGRDRKIKKSWNYTEFYPLNWPEVIEYFKAYEGLYGRVPSWRRTFENARIVDQRVVWT